MTEKWEERWAKRRGAVCLPYNVQVIIPHTCEPECPKAYEKLRKGMTKLFGGTTIYDATGYWIDDKGKEVPDDVKVVESAHSCMDDKQARRFRELVNSVAKMARQDAISVKTGQFMIIPKRKVK